MILLEILQTARAQIGNIVKDAIDNYVPISNSTQEKITYACEQLDRLMLETEAISKEQPQFNAASFLNAALKHMNARASTYDAPSGERSMGKTVAAFNFITGQNLTEEQGWLLMGILKMVRSQQGDYKADNYEDEAAYAGLRGECAARERA